MTWIASSLNTTMSYLQDLATHSQTPPTIIAMKKPNIPLANPQNTYNFFPLNYNILFNNTQTTSHRLCAKNYTDYTDNMSKVPTLANISSFLQIIHIANQPFQPWLLIYLYMPSHEEDLPLIPTIQNTIIDQVNGHLDHMYMLCGDFNRDIA